MTKPKKPTKPRTSHRNRDTTEASSDLSTRKRSRRQANANVTEDSNQPPAARTQEANASPRHPTVSPPLLDDADDVPPTPQCIIDAYYDDDEREERVGYKNPPKGTRFKKGRSGNPSGKRVKFDPPPGNRLMSIGAETLDAITRLMEGTVEDLQVKPDDAVPVALAKCLIGDALKKGGDARKLLISQFIQKPLQSERFLPKDPAMMEAEIMQTIANAIVDPTLTEKQYDTIIQNLGDYRAAYGGPGPLNFGTPKTKKRRPKRLH